MLLCSCGSNTPDSVPIRSVEETDYTSRKNVYEKLVADQKESDPLFDDNLFHTEIIPLGTITYDSLMDEIKPKKTARTKAVMTAFVRAVFLGFISSIRES